MVKSWIKATLVILAVVLIIGFVWVFLTYYRGNAQEGMINQTDQNSTLNDTMSRVYCTSESRNAEACTLQYQPVCGWFNSSVQCIKYPCAQTYSNPCIACQDGKVEYITEGTCPQ